MLEYVINITHLKSGREFEITFYTNGKFNSYGSFFAK